MAILLGQAAVSAIVGVLMALLTMKLSFARFRSERLWQREADSFAAILDSLHDMKRFLEQSFEDQVGNEMQGEERMNELRANWTKGTDELARAIDVVFLFPQRAVDALQKVQEGLHKESRNDFSWEYLDARIKFLDECLASTRKIARESLHDR